MFGISLTEFIVIIVIALIFIKPTELINIISNIIKIFKIIKNYFYSLQNDFNKIETLNHFQDYIIKDKKNNNK